MFFLYILGSYIIGSIPFGLIIAFLGYDVDIREKGSKNIGMTNVWRTVGVKPALYTLLGDVLKGWVMVAASPYDDITSIFWVSAAVLLGHCYSIFLQGEGGKGVATSLGVMLALSPLIALLSFGVWIFVRWSFKKSSLAALVSMFFLLPFTLFFNPEILSISLFIILLVVYRHKDNIQRLREGGE